uniref:Uncharacterized protein n=1 Tax=Panagrolaimus superbus TaxID=310955 RepID=A0A914XVC5_9BILA
MSSSHISHDSSDVTRHLPFEINPAFFPPPTIPIPINDIFSPVEFNYNFKTEHEAVIRYKEEQEKLEPSDDMASRQTTMDIISKLSYLPVSGSSKPKIIQKEQPIQETFLPSSHIQASAPSSNISQQQPSSFPSASAPPSNNPPQQYYISSNSQLQQQQQKQSIEVSSTVPVSSSLPIPGSSSTYAAGLLPTWTPPQLTLDDFFK